jgi:4-amino-4-deoxychorismate lyase
LYLAVNGTRVDPESCAVSAADRGFAYGDGVFRTLRVRRGRVPAWNRHRAKLLSDCSRIGLPAPDLIAIERDLAELGGACPDCVARITVTAGTGPRGYRRVGTPAATTVISAGSAGLAGLTALHRDNGVTARLCSLRLGSQPALAGVKHLNRLEQVLARAEWQDPAISEGITLDQDGHAICGTMTNLFIVEGARLVTPDLSRCGVAGVQRSRIIDWANERTSGCDVEALPVARLLRADALLLSNSVIGVWWVDRLDHARFARPAWLGELESALDADD